ncbi:cell division protein FtsL [Dokdonella sp.]|uniref:cell division protein FtsL n=1 Tax=Dokdonella sp. TaxID=2291710 RepID=UPI0026084DDE|nr:cell division protein FtsL [Dokdonella sp.]
MKVLGAIVLLILLAATLGSALAVVKTRQQSRSLFVELSRLGNERDDLNFEFGRLQLEQATWAENNRIEQIARGKLGMIPPAQAETVVVKR